MIENKYSVFLEINRRGWCMAHVKELPGCFAWDKTEKKALGKLPETIKTYLKFLKKNGEKDLKVSPKIKFEIIESQKGTCPVICPSKAAIFSYDLTPPSNDFLQKCLKWMSYNRKELLSKVKKLSNDVLDWKPDKNTRSIRETLNHIATAEWWYLSRLRDYKELYPVPEYSKDEIFKKLKKFREMAVKVLKNLSPVDRKKITTPQKHARFKNEKWTAGKMLRRFLEHEREHIETIDRELKLYKNYLKK